MMNMLNRLLNPLRLIKRVIMPPSSVQGDLPKSTGKWGIFEELADKKRKAEEESLRASQCIREIMDGTHVELTLDDAVQEMIEDVTDEYIKELDVYLVESLNWSGMRLRHACPVCLARIDGRPRALACGHVFCPSCCKKLMDQPSEDSTSDSDDSPDNEQWYTCPVCKSNCRGAFSIYW
jgi:hypothetical protein